jgi:hypothetical protein
MTFSVKNLPYVLYTIIIIIIIRWSCAVCGNAVFTVNRIHPRKNPHYMCIEICLQLTDCRTKRNNNIPLCARRLKVYYINTYNMRMCVCVRRYAAARRVNTSFPVLSGRDRLCSGAGSQCSRIALAGVYRLVAVCAARACVLFRRRRRRRRHRVCVIFSY